MLKLIMIRHKESYRFKADENKPDSFSNNWKNNSLDDFILNADGAEVFKCKCQSVANYCFGEQRPGDTAAHGDSVRLAVLRLNALSRPDFSTGKSTQSQKRETLTVKKLTGTQCRQQKTAIKTDAGLSTINIHFQKAATQTTHGAQAVSFCRQKTLKHSTGC